MFKLLLFWVEFNRNKLDCWRINGSGKFICLALKNVCNKKVIDIGYTTSYIYKKNGIAKQCRRTLLTMKDSLLIDSNLPVNFWAKAMDTTNYLQSWLPIMRADKSIIFPKETWTTVRQNVKYIRIFGSKASIYILAEKHLESNIHKT